MAAPIDRSEGPAPSERMLTRVRTAARVEGITKTVGVSTLVTGEIAQSLSPERILARRVARFLPVGMTTELDLYTIEPTPADVAARQQICARHALHAQALTAFEQGNWEKAFELLHPIVKEDAPARYLYSLAIQRIPPRDFHGCIELTTK